MVNPQYNQLIEDGAFPNQIDPWAEKGEHFHPIHGQMISILLQVLRKPLRDLGYVIGREPSLQIAPHFSSLPDILVESVQQERRKHLDYRQALMEADLEVGTMLVKASLDLDRVLVRTVDSGEVVTVLEIVSPNNKTKLPEIEHYQIRREMLLAQGIHCVELDLTRSVKRLLNDPIAHDYPYHIAVHLNNGETHFIGMVLEDSLKTFALPLQSEILPVELDKIYRQAYIETSTPQQILRAKHYTEEHLPFPSLLSDEERKRVLAKVKAWQAALKEAEG
jgi:hypothetical protein